jgi:hypothetical protein
MTNQQFTRLTGHVTHLLVTGQSFAQKTALSIFLIAALAVIS